MSTNKDITANEMDALVAGLRAGDSQAFESFVRIFANRALQIAQRILRNEADAADAVQNAFVSAMKSMHTFRAEAQLATWFHRIATNAALMKLRARKRREMVRIDDLTPSFRADGHRVEAKPAWSETPEQILERSDHRRVVQEKISQLPEDFRNVVILRDIQQLSTADTAQQLDVSESVVKTRLHRARQALRSLFEKEFVGG